MRNLKASIPRNRREGYYAGLEQRVVSVKQKIEYAEKRIKENK